MPQFNHAQLRIAPAHVSNELQFTLCVLIRMAVRPPGLATQGAEAAVIASLPEVDVGPALVVLAGGTAHPMFCDILQEGLPVFHILCYTIHVREDLPFGLL